MWLVFNILHNILCYVMFSLFNISFYYLAWFFQVANLERHAQVLVTLMLSYVSMTTRQPLQRSAI